EVLLGRARAPRRDVAHARDRHGASPLLVELGVLDELDGAGLARIALDQAAPLELVQVVVDRRARAEADRLSDLPHAGRVVATLAHVADVVEDSGLPFGEFVGQFRIHLQSVVGDVEAMLALRVSKRKPLFVHLTSERAFAILSNVCTPPVTGSNLGGRPVPAACARGGPLSWRAPWSRSASAWRWRPMAARLRPSRPSSCSRATRFGASRPSTIRRMMCGPVSRTSNKPTASVGRRSEEHTSELQS